MGKDEVELSLRPDCSAHSPVIWSVTAANFGKLICKLCLQKICNMAAASHNLLMQVTKSTKDKLTNFK